MANGALYIPVERPNIARVIDGVHTDGSLFKKATFFEWSLGGEQVRLNVMPKLDIPEHLLGFRGYIANLSDEEEQKKKVFAAISATKTVLGLVTHVEFGEENDLWASLLSVVTNYGGCIFAYNSVWLANGDCIVGPMRNENGA